MPDDRRTGLPSHQIRVKSYCEGFVSFSDIPLFLLLLGRNLRQREDDNTSRSGGISRVWYNHAGEISGRMSSPYGCVCNHNRAISVYRHTLANVQFLPFGLIMLVSRGVLVPEINRCRQCASTLEHMFCCEEKSPVRRLVIR